MTEERAPKADPALLAGQEAEHRRRVVSLHARRAQDLYGFALRLGLSDEDAADAVQETMLRLWRALAAARDVHDVDAWAFRTTYHLAIDQHRLRRRVAASLQWLAARRREHTTDPNDSAHADALWQAVDGLPERQRAVLYLRYRADLPFDRIGLVLGITSGTARSHATTALATLRRRLEREVS